jgi:hypothetical protein
MKSQSDLVRGWLRKADSDVINCVNEITLRVEINLFVTQYYRSRQGGKILISLQIALNSTVICHSTNRFV